MTFIGTKYGTSNHNMKTATSYKENATHLVQNIVQALPIFRVVTEEGQ